MDRQQKLKDKAKITDFPYQELVLLLSSIIALLIFALGAPYDLGDSDHYISFARAIAKLQGPTRAEQSFGYALLLVLSLSRVTHSLTGILLIQAAMAVAIIWFIYRICSFFSIRFAFIMAILAMISLVPYNFQVIIFHDQSQLFFLFFLTYALFVFKESPSYKTAFILLLAYDLITCFRPTYALLLPIVLLNFYIVLHKDVNRLQYLKLIVVMLASILAVHLASYGIYLYFIHKTNDKNHIITTVGVQTLENVCKLSHQISGAFSQGVASLQFKQLLLMHFANSKNDLLDFQKVVPNFNQIEYQERFLKYKNEPYVIVNQFLKDLSPERCLFIVNFGRRELGEKEADRLFLKMALEQYYYHPSLLFFIVKDGLYNYVLNGRPQGINFYPASWYTFSQDELKKLVKNGGDKRFYDDPPFDHFAHLHGLYSSFMVSLNETWSSYYPIFHTTMMTGAMSGFFVGLFFLFIYLWTGKHKKYSREMYYVLNIGLIYITYIFPLVLLVGSGFRYHSALILFLFVMCGISFRKLLISMINLIKIILDRFSHA
jgi:hypothetical protein